MSWHVSSRAILLLAVLMAAAGGVVAAGPGGARAAELALAPESALPDFVRRAPPQVKEAYRFAIANPELLRAFPCYCGCGSVGHKSNLECYVKQVRPDGSIEFDNHAFG
jgi:hypothetical protein